MDKVPPVQKKTKKKEKPPPQDDHGYAQSMLKGLYDTYSWYAKAPPEKPTVNVALPDTDLKSKLENV